LLLEVGGTSTIELAKSASPTMARGQLKPVMKKVVRPGEVSDVRIVLIAISSPRWKCAFP